MTWARAGLLGLMLAVASACAGVGSSSPTVNVTGSWMGTWVTDDQQGSGEFRLSLRQIDEKVSGVLLMTGVVPAQLNGYIEGTVVSDQFTFTRGAVTVSLKLQGNNMRGRIAGLSSPASVDVYRAP